MYNSILNQHMGIHTEIKGNAMNQLYTQKC